MVVWRDVQSGNGGRRRTRIVHADLVCGMIMYWGDSGGWIRNRRTHSSSHVIVKYFRLKAVRKFSNACCFKAVFVTGISEESIRVLSIIRCGYIDQVQETVVC
jgi:hypothetical protein